MAELSKMVLTTIMFDELNKAELPLRLKRELVCILYDTIDVLQMLSIQISGLPDMLAESLTNLIPQQASISEIMTDFYTDEETAVEFKRVLNKTPIETVLRGARHCRGEEVVKDKITETVMEISNKQVKLINLPEAFISIATITIFTTITPTIDLIVDSCRIDDEKFNKVLVNSPHWDTRARQLKNDLVRCPPPGCIVTPEFAQEYANEFNKCMKSIMKLSRDEILK